ncbi:nucleotidyltransferase domain-containing protein [Streptomyces europaeiscabiei]|uniref:SMODS domain-containing nucleotidyltransferase n=1 Tax=Streptomyces europaeiscabiei TaxID=146819 RepID=UPI002E18B9AE
MGYIDDAFTNLKHNLEITQTEQNLAKARHEAIRDFVRSHWDLADDFLTGSYRRDTKTKKLKDIDIFVVLDANGSLRFPRDAECVDRGSDGSHERNIDHGRPQKVLAGVA